MYLVILGALLVLWSMRPMACGKEVKTVTFCAVPVNHTATVPHSPFSIVLHPFQKEQAHVVYMDGSTDPWKDTNKAGSTIYRISGTTPCCDCCGTHESRPIQCM